MENNLNLPGEKGQRPGALPLVAAVFVPQKSGGNGSIDSNRRRCFVPNPEITLSMVVQYTAKLLT